MNLVKIQSELQTLPSGPQTLQLLAQYANGMNPLVPPYIALGELQRRKKQEEEAQQQQQGPQGTVKDQIEQSVGLMGLQAAQGQGQMPPQGMPPQGMPPQGMPPQGMPPQGMPPQGAPQQMGPGMAAGGMASLPVRDDMFNFADGGIVAFAGGAKAEDDIDDPEGDDGGGGGDKKDDAENGIPILTAASADAGADAEASTGLTVPPGTPPEGFDPRAELIRGLQQNAVAQAARPPAPPVGEALRTQLAKEKPDIFGVLEKPQGLEYLAGIKKAQEMQAAEDPRMQQDLETRRRLALYNALIQGGRSSRKGQGLSAVLGGFGAAMGPALEELMGAESKLRMRPIERAELLNKAEFEVDKLQRANAEGRVKDAEKAHIEIAKIANQLGISQNRLTATVIASMSGMLGRETTARAATEAARIRANAPKAPPKPTDLQTSTDIELAALLEAGYPDNAITRKEARNIAEYNMGRSAATISAETKRLDAANKAFTNLTLLDPATRTELKDAKAKGPDALKAKVEEIRERVKKEYGVRPDADLSRLAGTGGVPTAKPSATPGATAPRGTRENPIKLD